ncbi:MAG: YigZ family protein [Pseudomonadota bacterium]
MDTYQIPAERFEHRIDIKRSTFITCIGHTRGVAAANAFVQEQRVAFPDANHHCYAYIAGAPNDIYQVGKNDDGEPRDTAGKPMLNVLTHSGIGEITVVVVRYFGGVKLGAGGLVRAYTQSVSVALTELPTQSYVRCDPLIVALPYTLLGRLEHWLDASPAQILDKQFGAHVTLTLSVPVRDIDALKEAITELGQGSIDILPENESESE